MRYGGRFKRKFDIEFDIQGYRTPTLLRNRLVRQVEFIILNIY